MSSGALGRSTVGPLVPPTSFWPRPNVQSRMLRIDFDPAKADALLDAPTLTAALALIFGQRRKMISSVIRRKNAAFPEDLFAAALAKAGIDSSLRAENVPPEQYPNNSADGAEDGYHSIDHSTAHSINCAFVRLATSVGYDKVVATAKALGITKDNLEPVVLNETLGTKEQNTLTMATVMATIANHGVHHTPYTVQRSRAMNAAQVGPTARPSRTYYQPA